MSNQINHPYLALPQVGNCNSDSRLVVDEDHNGKLRLERVNPFKPEFTIVIFIHYKPRIAVAILDL